MSSPRTKPPINEPEYMDWPGLSESIRVVLEPQLGNVKTRVTLALLWWMGRGARRRLMAFSDEVWGESPVRALHCSPFDNGPLAVVDKSFEGRAAGSALIRYPYTALNLASEGQALMSLVQRGSTVFGSSFSLTIRDEPGVMDCLERAAKLIWSTSTFWLELAEGKLGAGLEGAGGSAEASYYQLFSTNRVPVSRVCDVLERRPYSEHVAVFCEGQVYVLSVLASDGVLSPEEILYELEWIKRDVEDISGDERQPSAGALTSLERHTWCQMRARLLEMEEPRIALEAIDSALFCVSLQLDEISDHRDAIWRHVRDRNVDSRWYDKSMQLLVFGDGAAGFCFEQTAVDPAIAVSFADRVARRAADAAGLGAGSDQTYIRHRPPRLSWYCRELPVWDWVSQAADAHANESHHWIHSSLKTKTIGAAAFRERSLESDAAIKMIILAAFAMHYERLPEGFAHGVSMSHISGGRMSWVPMLSRQAIELTEALGRGRRTDNLYGLLFRAVEKTMGLYAQAHRGEDLYGTLTAHLCFACEGDLAHRAELVTEWLEQVQETSGLKHLLAPELVTVDFSGQGMVDAGTPLVSFGGRGLGVSFVVSEGHVIFDFWRRGENADDLHRFAEVVENVARRFHEILKR